MSPGNDTDPAAYFILHFITVSYRVRPVACLHSSIRSSAGIPPRMPHPSFRTTLLAIVLLIAAALGAAAGSGWVML